METSIKQFYLKTIIKSLMLIVVVVFISCEKNDTDPFPDLKDGFSIVINDSVVYNYTQIDFYDFSSHLIYLKDGNTFSFKNEGIFRVFANKTEIYSGNIVPSYSSTMGDKPLIMVEPALYHNYIIGIEYYSTPDVISNDPREDPRIIKALKTYDQFYNGLSCSIDTINFTSDTSVTVSLVLTNNDNFNYYYLDQDKMGKNLFHYYTNGLNGINADTYERCSFFDWDSLERPEPRSRFDINWFSLLESNKSTKINISYYNFEPLSKGTYYFYFQFPVMNWLKKELLQQDNGRIWLGTLFMEKKITIE